MPYLHERTQFVDVVFKSDDLLTISQASKALNLEYGRNTLCKRLREFGIFFKNTKEQLKNTKTKFIYEYN